MARFGVVLSICIFLGSALVANAQYTTDLQTGQVPFQSYDANEIDSINLSNGNVSLRIPLLDYPQIGGVLKLRYSALYNSKAAWAGNNCLPYPPYTCDYVWLNSGTKQNPTVLNGTVWANRVSVVPEGFLGRTNSGKQMVSPISFTIGNQSYTVYSACEADDSCHLLDNADGTYRSLDATGISANSTTGQVTDKRGVRYYSYQDATGGQQLMVQDPYGNSIYQTGPKSIGALVIPLQDTMGRSIPQAPTTSDTSGCLASGSNLKANSWTPPGPNGGQFSFKFCSAGSQNGGNIPPSGHSTTVYGPGSQSILLPDGRSWVFQFGASAGELTQVTLPTGGTISYTYQYEALSGFSSGGHPNLSRFVTSRTLSDGTRSYMWTYTYTGIAGGFTATVTTPAGDQVVHTFRSLASGDGFFETSAQYYHGTSSSGTLLRTETPTYNYSTYTYCSTIGNCTINVTPASKTVKLDDGSTSKTTYTYDGSFTITHQSSGTAGSYGDLTYQYNYDYNGALLCKTANTYIYATNSSYKALNMLGRISSTTFYNGSSQQAAQAKYGYDEGMSSLTGSNTSIQRWLNTTNTYLTTKYAYNSNGTRSHKTDPLLNQTNYLYSSTYNGAYLTQVQEPTVNGVAHNFYYGYDFNTGLKTSETDYNGQATNYSYDSAARPYQVLSPDGGQVTFSHSAPSAQLSTTSTQLVSASPSVNIVSTTLFDALNRVSQTQLTSDPDLTTYVDTTYDSLGRKATVTNPYRTTSDTTYGIATYNYDSLNRVTSVLGPDGSYTSTAYLANCSTVTDQVGTRRKSCSDALGRVTGVWEAPSGLNYETDYGYDALGNLTSVTQKGGAPSTSWRVRTFTYDSLSRTVCAANPEMQSVTCPASVTSNFPAGAETYTYDADSNLIGKASPAPNQTSASTSVTATYVHDVLNRITTLSYTGASPTTPTVQYGYDGVVLSGCTTAPPTLTDSYPIGLRTSMCDGSGGTSWSHDQLGRVGNEKRQIGASSALTTTYAYNADGSLNNVTNPGGGKTVTYTPGGAGRPLAANDGSGNNYVKSAQYTAFGGLTSMINGYTSSFAGITTANAFSNRLQPILLSASSPSGTVFSLCYDFHLGVTVATSPCNFSASTQGDNGSPYAIKNNRDNTRTQTYTYDSLNRIASGQSSGSQWGEQFTIDAWGNLTNRTGVTGKTYYEPLSVSVGANDHMSGFTYDAAGNLTQNGSVTFTYDAENRLIWTNANGGFSYIYDGDGSRVERCSSSQAGVCPNGSSATLYWRDTDGGDPLVETDQTGAIQNQYVFFNNNRIARLDVNGNVHYYFSDHLGSHAVVENATGSICEQDIDYYPYGGVQQDYCAVVPQNYKFVGTERDRESGLDLMKVRNYSSSLGRMLTPDPRHADGFAHMEDPQSWNGYAYARNNPLLFVDPSGRAYCRVSGSNPNSNDSQETSAEAMPKKAGPGTDLNTKDGCEKAGGEWVLDSGDQGVKTEAVDVKATYSTTDEFIDNVSWLANYALEQTFGQSLGAFQTMTSTHDPVEFALAAAVVVTPMGGGSKSEAITITKSRLAHVTARHLIFKAGEKSAFNIGEDVVRLVKAAEATAPVKQSFGRNFERIVDAGRPVGMDRATGQLTSIYTVITTPNGKMWTAFPGRP